MSASEEELGLSDVNSVDFQLSSAVEYEIEQAPITRFTTYANVSKST